MKRLFIASALLIAAAISAVGQMTVNKGYEFGAQLIDREMSPDSIEADKLVVDTLIDVDDLKLPITMFGSLVYTPYSAYLTDLRNGLYTGRSRYAEDESPVLRWIEHRKYLNGLAEGMYRRLMFENPSLVPYNEALLPEAPAVYHAVVDPSKAKIEIAEDKIAIDAKNAKGGPGSVDIERRYWLHATDLSLQFSQAYNSPNWYQGGNNNLNAIFHGAWNVKLNEAFNPDLMFENTISYKLAMNSAPEDSLRNYSISEDLFQVNTKFGVKAWQRWFYSVSMLFKTQFLNNYKQNTRDLKASFMAPGELNIGLGMTYNYKSPNGRLTFNASIAPLSYNLKTCLDTRVDPTLFSIKAGHKTVSQYGSNAEAKLNCKLAYNITYTSRLFLFTDYNYAQGDWENTFSFDINKFLSTQLYIHLRYDSTTRHIPDSDWQKLQLKEILSLGFYYKFATR